MRAFAAKRDAVAAMLPLFSLRAQDARAAADVTARDTLPCCHDV